MPDVLGFGRRPALTPGDFIPAGLTSLGPDAGRSRPRRQATYWTVALNQNVESSLADAPIVLLVEDEPLIRLVASDTLTDAGFRTLEACSAEEAMTLLEAKPEIVALVTDVRMPGPLDGFGLAHLAASRWPETGIVITSAQALPGEGDLPKGTEFLAKPYQPSALLSAVRKVTGEGVVTPFRSSRDEGAG
jgi:CheY-like chemotaxis protein